MQLAEKKCLVTGAASGIGREIARRLAAENAKLALLDRDVHGLQTLEAELSAKGTDCFSIVCDLGQPKQIEQAAAEVLERWGTLHVLINNAGIGMLGPTHELTHADREKIMQINLHAPFALFQYFSHHLLNEDEAHVVNLASIFGLVPSEHSTAYAVTKYGLVGLTESLRAEYSRWGLGVSLICPGFVDTALVHNLPDQTPTGYPLKKPSPWMMTSPQKVASQVVRAIRKNRRLTLTTPLAHWLYHFKRLVPGMYDFMSTFSRTKLLKMIGLRREKSAAAAKESKTADQDSGGRRAA